MKSLKKVEIVDAIATKTGLPKADSRRALDAFASVVNEALAKGNRVPIAGFGTFGVSKRSAREGRNPRTGEKVKISARNAVKFTPGTALKDAVNK